MGRSHANRAVAVLLWGSLIMIMGAVSAAAGKSKLTQKSKWSPVGGGLTAPHGQQSEVSSLLVSGGNLYVGGSFEIAGDQAVNNIARWNETAWSAVGNGLGVSDYVSTVAVDPNTANNLIIGGFFTNIGGEPAKYVAELVANEWRPIGGGLRGPPSAVAVNYARGRWNIYAGGYAALSDTMAWNGNRWSSLGDSFTPARVEALEFYTSTACTSNISEFELLAGVSPFHSQEVHGALMRWNGTSWNNPWGGVNGSVYALRADCGDLYVGGSFTGVSGVSANSIAHWNGTHWSKLGCGIEDGVVNAIVVYGSDVYVGGRFSRAGGVPANAIAKWDGQKWSSLGLGLNSTTGDSYVRALAAFDGYLYAGGHFTLAGGEKAMNIAKWPIHAD